jgi:hypothetical protein
MKQISAVEWLVKQISYLTSYGTIITHHKDITELVEQAKEMEKEQICNAYNFGQQIPPFEYAEQYYNETFKSE